jgi:hypothetical protein
MLFRAAETFTDDELRSIRAALPDPTEPHDNLTRTGGLQYDIHTEKVRVSRYFDELIPRGPFNLMEHLGLGHRKHCKSG